MIFTESALAGLFIIEPKVFKDPRGYFLESYSQKVFEEFIPSNAKWVQDNESQSQKNVVRGLHAQLPPFAQAKLVRVIKGAVLDIAVDIRKNSSTYGQHFGLEISEQNKKMLLIPEGFLHGFKTLEDDTIFSYKCSNYYAPQAEVCVKWDDPNLNIDWYIQNPIISDKDQSGLAFSELNSPF